MATVLDAMVVASAYDTSGNGGRKLVRLSNGWLVASVTDPSTTNRIAYLRVSKDNGSTFTDLCFVQEASFLSVSATTFALVNKGTNVYWAFKRNQDLCVVKIDALTQTNVNVFANKQTVDLTQSDNTGAVSMCLEGNEIHLAHASKNTAYVNSFNIRYAKGTINADGSVAWGAVEQVTTQNTAGGDIQNPSIVLKNGNVPVISVEFKGMYFSGTTSASDSTNYGIYVFSRDNTLGTNTKLLTGWTYKTIHAVGSSYIQSSPLSMFVPQSVNGLANGRIWVAWSGKNGGAYFMPMVSYSDDGGVTWSAVRNLVDIPSSDLTNLSITANKSNKVYALWQTGAGNVGGLSTTNGTTWTQVSGLPTGSSVSTLYNPTFDFSYPLFIYKDVARAKIGFYGTWTTTTISVAQGALGQKTDKANLFTYAITTDGSMSTITEKVNGVTIGTKTATSGQSLIAGLTQAQWDAVRFGKYANATGGLNTLTVTMGTEVYTYTFDKRLATDADVLSAVKAVQDADSVATPAKKALLASVIRTRGGTVSDTDAFEAMASAIAGFKIGKVASGVTTVDSTNSDFLYAGGTILNIRKVIVSGLDFNPSLVFLGETVGGNWTVLFPEGVLQQTQTSPRRILFGGSSSSTNQATTVYSIRLQAPASNVNGFVLPTIQTSGQSVNWYALEII